jgi:hypothetical protein
MAESFNTMQDEMVRAALGLSGAREGLRAARNELTEINRNLEERVAQRTKELEALHKKLVEAAWDAGMAEVAIGVLHNVGNVLNSVNVSAASSAASCENQVTALAGRGFQAGRHRRYLTPTKGMKLPGTW